MHGIEQIISKLEKDKSFMDCVSHWEKTKAKEASWTSLPEGLHPKLEAALKKSGISQLYTHQKTAFELAQAGKNFVIVTPTASGKTLCYNIPTLNQLLKDKNSRALFLFPTKALSQDQQASINELIKAGGLDLRVNTYDGDTPSSLRLAARKSARIIISNPDMLHSGIMPNHIKWITFFQNISYIVIDEVHYYRGIFGSHMANVFRRLRRILKHYGSSPQFICCSATIGNPLDLSSRIIGEKLELINENGAPSGEKNFVLYNPPLIEMVENRRRGVVLEAQRIALQLIKENIKTIIFAKSRIRTELISAYINKSLANFYNRNYGLRVESYRGGYLPSERRAIEKGLREGEICGVVSTNALELGIDIGGLDAAVLAGFPGAISSVWQQAGRSGRKGNSSLAVLIASNAPLDQFLVKNYQYFLSKPPESAFVNPDNPFILMDHLKCAAFELPFNEQDQSFGEVSDLLDFLEENGVLHKRQGCYYWSDRSYPAEKVSLRSAVNENVVIVDCTHAKNQVIGEMDRASAKEMLHKHAVYIHRGEQYMVRDLDIENLRAYVELSEVNYYTDAISKRDIKVLHIDDEAEGWGLQHIEGDILLRTQVTMFKKIKYKTHENLGYGVVDLPEEEMHTRAAILILSPKMPSGRAFAQVPQDAKPYVLYRFANLMVQVAPLYLLCSSSDIGVSESKADPMHHAAALYFYDKFPGGSGLVSQMRLELGKILRTCLDTISECPCQEGCPSCIGPEDPNEPEHIDYKQTTLDFLRTWQKG